MDLETFDQFWQRAPGFGDLEYVPVKLVMKACEASFIAGQNSAMTACSEKLGGLVEKIDKLANL